jgi:hypothetical protein
MTFGALAVGFGVPGADYLQEDSASGDHYTGLLSILARVVLIASGPVTLWRSRRSDGDRTRRYARRALVGGAAAVVRTLVVFPLFVFPVGFAYIYTHTGRTRDDARPRGAVRERQGQEE